MSWPFHLLQPAAPRRFAFWAIHLGVSAFALWGAWAWIAAVSASDCADGSTVRVASDRSQLARKDRDNLALQCAAIDDVGPVKRTTAQLDPAARKSYSTVWLQEGQPKKGGLTIRGMSPVGAAPKDPVTRIIEAGRPEALTASLAPPRVIHRPTGPVVRSAPSLAAKNAGVDTTTSAAAAEASDAPVAKISWPGGEDDGSHAALRQLSAPRHKELLQPVADAATETDKAASLSAPPVVSKTTQEVAPPVIVLKLPGEEAAAVRAAALAPKQKLPTEPRATSKAKVVAKPLETTQRIAMRGGVKTTAPPIVAAPASPPRSPGTWNPESAPVVPSQVVKKPVATELVVTPPVETSRDATESVVTAAPVVTAPVVLKPVASAPVVTGPSAALVSQQSPPRAQPTVAAAEQAATVAQARPMAQAAMAPPPATTPYVSSEESRHLAIISKRSQEHVDYGFDLAERGALYSAELEFSQALQLVAQALDAYHHTQAHSKAVAAGLTALREADDFVPRAGQPPIKLEEVISGHKTPVWNAANTEDVPPLIAMQRYYAFAQQQFMVAAGTDPSAAMALYGMGRLQTALASEYGVKKMTAGPKAMALYQATISVDPQNYLAANELGVMLARYGQLREAEVALRHSVQVAPRPENWKNLAEVYDRMGDAPNAQNARAQHQLAMQSGTRPGRQTTADRPPIKLVDNDTFQKESGPAGADEMLAAGKSDGKPTANGAKTPDGKESKGSLGWIGDKVSEGMTRVVGPPKPKSTQIR